jgi:electron transfer flavoprotein alpha subunit
MTVLVLVEQVDGAIAASSLEAITAARTMADALGGDVHALAFSVGEGFRAASAHGVDAVHLAGHELLVDYGPDAWGETLAQLAAEVSATAVVAAGTDRGNEVVAQAAARMGEAMAANCVEVDPLTWEVTRMRWGGSLLERAVLSGEFRLVTIAEHSVESRELRTGEDLRPAAFEPRLDESATVTMVRDRMVVTQGTTLATAPVVVGGGRGVGSAEGFERLEQLAGLLGGVVGCSRVVTNNGWRPHTDQVGQTGTRIAPQLYVACGISGAIQHWVGAMASKHILAINTDPEANMVARADYAVVGDLHEVIPAVIDEIERRRA